MSGPSSTEIASRMERNSRMVACFMGCVCLCAGVGVMLSWLLGFESPKSIVAGWATMKLNTSLGLAALGVSVILHARPSPKHLRWAPVAMALVSCAIGCATWAEHLGLDLASFDRLFGLLGDEVSEPVRMSRATATMLLSLGAVAAIRGQRSSVLEMVLLAVALSISLAALCGYLFDPGLLRRSIAFETIAVHTASCGLLAALGLLLAKPKAWPLSLVYSAGAAGQMLRFGLPLAIVSIVVFNVLLAIAYRQQWLTEPVAQGFGLFGALGVLVGTSLFSARIVDRNERSEREAYERLSESESRFRLVSDAAPVLVWISDTAGEAGFLNKGWISFTGGQTGPVEAGDLLRRIHPDDRGEFLAGLNQAVGALRPVVMEFRLRAAGGDYRCMRASATELPERYSDRASVIGSAVDVTEERRQHDRQLLLMRELDHRVKNNLAAVLSVAEATFASTADSNSFMNAFQGRLMAMAHAHTALASGRWTGLELGDLIRTVVAPLASSESGRVVVSGSSAHVPAQSVPALAMALHELGTNAQKYGALSVSGGSVSIAWTLDTRDSLQSRVTLEWTERGGPAPHADPTPGLGTALLRGLVESELGGAIDTHYEPAGLRCRITFDSHAWRGHGHEGALGTLAGLEEAAR